MKLFPKTINKAFDKFNKIQKILTMLSIIIVLILIYNFVIPNKRKKEGMIIRKENFTIHRDDDIYDDFYANILDTIMNNSSLNEFQIKSLFQSDIVGINNTSRLLDIGSGTGQNTNLLTQSNIECQGIDKSNSMINFAKSNYPDCKFKQGNVVGMGSSMLFNQATFSHILLLNFTIYYINDKERLFKNCYNWLLPGGSLILHLVNRDNFDKISNIKDTGGRNYKNNISKKSINLLIDDSNLKSIINSDVKNNNSLNIEYKSDYKTYYDNNYSRYTETFSLPNGKIRQNEHKLFIPKQADILAIAKSCGYILTERIPLDGVGYKNQNIYVLRRPE